MSDIQASLQFVYTQRTASRTAFSRLLFVILMIDPPKIKGDALPLSYPMRFPLRGVDVRTGIEPVTFTLFVPIWMAGFLLLSATTLTLVTRVNDESLLSLRGKGDGFPKRAGLLLCKGSLGCHVIVMTL